MGIDAEMYVVVRRKITDKEIVRLSYEAGAAFGAERFRRCDEDRTHNGEVWWKAHHNISRVERITQDGPDWDPPEGHTLLRVHLVGRYWGPGYERGDLPFLIVLAEWLERKLPGCKVRYGGDSAGVLAEPWGPEERKKFLDHFAGPEGTAYRTSRSPYDPPSPGHPTCAKCGGIPMTQYMWGRASRAGYSCHGCGDAVETSDGGRTFTKVDRQD